MLAALPVRFACRRLVYALVYSLFRLVQEWNIGESALRNKNSRSGTD